MGDAWPLERLMTEVVGSGPKSAEDMTREQAMEAMERILAGDPDPTTLGAFWLANRWKRNTPAELAAFVDVMREESVITAAPSCDPVDCGANYDGKHSTALLGVAAGLVAAAAGIPVVVHSGDRVPTQRATAYRHVLEELGVETDLEPDESARMVDSTGFGFYYQPRYNPGVHALLERRDQMGVRTFINTIETLANPANASVHLGSFYHLAFAKKLTDTVAASEALSVDRVVMFQGLEGYDDVRPGHTTVAAWSREGDFTDFAIRTDELGLSLEEADLAVDDLAADSAAITEAVLAGERTGPAAEAVAINAAVRLYAGGAAETIADGLEVALDTLAGGQPAERLAAIRSFAD